MNHNKKNIKTSISYMHKWFFFVLFIKKRNCICLSMHPTVSSKPLKKCEFACLKNNVSNEFLKCGGSSVYSVFVSSKWILTQRFVITRGIIKFTKKIKLTDYERKKKSVNV